MRYGEFMDCEGGKALFVSGDAIVARMQLPVYRELARRGVKVLVDVDGSSLATAGEVWKEAGVHFEEMLDIAGDRLEDAATAASVIFAGSSSVAYNAECFALFYGNLVGRITVVGSDSWHSHARKPWRNWMQDKSTIPNFWIAIDEEHQRKILQQRALLTPDNVPILGQPAFDTRGNSARNIADFLASLV